MVQREMKASWSGLGGFSVDVVVQWSVADSGEVVIEEKIWMLLKRKRDTKDVIGMRTPKIRRMLPLLSRLSELSRMTIVPGEYSSVGCKGQRVLVCPKLYETSSRRTSVARHWLDLVISGL